MNKITLSACLLAAAVCAPAFADDHHAPAAAHRDPRPASYPKKDVGARSVGVHVVAHPEQPMHVKNNPPHEVIIHDTKTNKDERHVVVVDHRPVHVVDHDRRLRVVVRGYRPAHDWNRFHRANGMWFRSWGIQAWDEVGTVTCEATNESTGELYPVSEDRDAKGWDDGTVNTMLDQALDDCFAEANGAQCGPVTPTCSFQAY